MYTPLPLLLYITVVYVHKSHVLTVLYSAGVAGATSSFLTSPLDMAKLRLQVCYYTNLLTYGVLTLKSVMCYTPLCM